MAHDALEGLAFNSFGSSGINGMISVCIRETLIPAAESTATRSPGWADRAVSVSEDTAGAPTS
jgi:hypothetical protein